MGISYRFSLYLDPKRLLILRLGTFGQTVTRRRWLGTTSTGSCKNNFEKPKTINQVFNHNKDDIHQFNYAASKLSNSFTLNEGNHNTANPFQFVSTIVAQFLPKSYPHSIRNADEYRYYSLGNMSSTFLGSINGVLSMQALLHAVGLHNNLAIPLSGALNWLLKDGFGQLGGVLYASTVNIKFDAHPKFWKLTSTMVLEAACLMELLLPLLVTAASGYDPWLGGYAFLMVASVSNVLKNISFLTASASRACLNKSFAIHENLADITAKCGSQATLASMLGTSTGIFIVSILGDDLLAKLAVFVTCSLGNIWGNYWALTRITVQSLTPAHVECILDTIEMSTLVHMNNGMNRTEEIIHIPTPDELRTREHFLLPPMTELRSRLPRLSIGSNLRDAFETFQQFEESWELYSSRNYVIQVTSEASASRESLSIDQWLEQSMNRFRRSRRRSRRRTSGQGREVVHLMFKQNASKRDVLAGMIHAFYIRCRISENELLEDGKQSSPAETAVVLDSSLLQFVDRLANQLESNKAWTIEEMLLETQIARIDYSYNDPTPMNSIES